MMIFIEMNGNANLQLSPAITDLPDTSSFSSKNKSRHQVYAAKHILHDLQVLYNHTKDKIRTSLFTFPPKLHFNLIHNSYTLSLSLSFYSLRENFNIPGYTALNPAKTHYTATHNCSRSQQKWDVQYKMSHCHLVPVSDLQGHFGVQMIHILKLEFKWAGWKIH